MSNVVDNTAKISLVVEVADALTNVEKIRNALLKISKTDLGISNITKETARITTEAGKASKSVNEITSKLNQAKKELANYMSKNTAVNLLGNTDAEFVRLKDNLAQALKAKNTYDNLIKELSGKNVSSSKQNEQAITQSVKEETKKRLSYAEQARIKQQEIAREYASGKYNKVYYNSDKDEYRNLNYKNAVFKQDMDLQNIFTYTKAIANLKKQIEMNAYTDKGYNKSAQYTKDLEQLRQLQLEYKKLANDIKNLTQVKKEAKTTNLTPTYEKEIRDMQNAIQSNIRNNANYMGSEAYQKDITHIRQLKDELNKIKSDIKGVDKEVKNVNTTVEKTPKIVKKTSNEFKSYQQELARVEREASRVFHELSGENLNIAKQTELRKELERLTKEYQKLNKESVAFRKQVGVSSSRGFYDLNSNYDYFLAKFRSKITAGIASQIEQFSMNAIPNFVNTMSEYQQNRVNFGQVLPNSLGDNMEFMNKSMRDFISIASDYGASVQDVVEAGRLWGRQYKDVAIIQELVRNSTKLSITDNMSLTEVNKGLEATMQQYNVHLKSAAEAQAVSGKVVDTWAKLADNAVVTASDLAKANEQSAGAAYQAGVGFDYLNAMIATMSGATGKAGAEIGRSIRSMLVSMNTPKAQKFFDELGIATREMGTDGVVRVRSYEKVITELMEKIKTSPKDISKMVLAMSGGKYQYNNVMALLTNFDQFQKNLQSVQTSSGWAEAQVGQQYETISRQTLALQADIQQLVVTLDEAGSSNGIGSLIQSTREFVQVLAQLDPSVIKNTGLIIAMTLGLRTLVSVVSSSAGAIMNLSNATSSFGSVLGAMNNGTLKASQGIKYIGMSCMSTIGMIVGLITVMYTLYGLAEAYYKSANKVQIAREEIKATNDKIAAYNKYLSVLQEANSAEKDNAQSKQDLAIASGELKEAIGEEAYVRVMGSKDIIGAIKAELEALNQRKLVEKQALLNSVQTSIKRTEEERKQVEQRISLMETELNALKESMKQRIALFETTMQSMNVNSKLGRRIFANLFGIGDYENELQNYQYNIENAKARLSELNTSLEADRKKAKELSGDISTLIKGRTGSEVTKDPVKTPTSSTSTSTPAQKAEAIKAQIEANRLQAEYNRLLYDAKTSKTEYETALKKVNQDIKYSLNLQDSINKKTSVYENRLTKLKEEKQKFVDYQNKLIALLDEEMSKNKEVARAIGYSVDGKDIEKLAAIEINKELFQQSKAWNTIITKITAVNSKVAEYNKEIQNTDFSKQEAFLNTLKTVMDNQIAKINNNYDVQSAVAGRLPFDELQQDRIDLARKTEIAEAYKREVERINNEILKIQHNNNEADVSMLQQRLDEERVLYEQAETERINLKRQKELELAQTVENSMTTQFSNMLLQGQSFSNTMKNIWNDLCSYVIKELLRVYVFQQLTNMIMGKPKTADIPNLSLPPIDLSIGGHSHTGSSVGGFPKMHTGGMVEQGRLGVVPKLKNDEVVRTLQVGEEVNSVADRRSNEILATVAMKAIDARNQQPNNINIMAMDARTFAEYMNDNADVLVAVLNKQGALGRK